MAMDTTKAIVLATANQACMADLNTNTLRITLLHLLATLPSRAVMVTAGLDLLNRPMRTSHILGQLLMEAVSKIHLLVLHLGLANLNTELIVVQRILLSQPDPAHLCKVVDRVLRHKA